MSKKEERKMSEMLKANGYEKVRDKKHAIYKNKKNGRIIVISKSPSDYRSRRNTIRDFKLQLRQSQAVAIV